MPSRPQRYRLTAEFVLRDRGDYNTYRQVIASFFKSLDSPSRFQSDFLSIEKVEEEKPRG